MFLHDGPWWEQVVAATMERARYAEGTDALRAAIEDPLVADAVLFEGGVFAEFLDTRGQLLPDDERLLAEQWLLVSRSVHEVEHIDRGHGFTVRDVRTSDRHQVSERRASTQLHERRSDLCRGDTHWRYHAGLRRYRTCRIDPPQRADRPVGQRTGPGGSGRLPHPTARSAGAVQHRGRPADLLRSQPDSTNPTALAQALDDIYDRADDTEADTDQMARWFEHITTDGNGLLTRHRGAGSSCSAFRSQPSRSAAPS